MRVTYDHSPYLPGTPIPFRTTITPELFDLAFETPDGRGTRRFVTRQVNLDRYGTVAGLNVFVEAAFEKKIMVRF